MLTLSTRYRRYLLIISVTLEPTSLYYLLWSLFVTQTFLPGKMRKQWWCFEAAGWSLDIKPIIIDRLSSEPGLYHNQAVTFMTHGYDTTSVWRWLTAAWNTSNLKPIFHIKSPPQIFIWSCETPDFNSLTCMWRIMFDVWSIKFRFLCLFFVCSVLS